MASHQLSSGDLTADRRAHYARLYAEAGDFDAAVDLQAQALELAPGWAAGWYGLGGYREKSGDMSGAADAWREVLTLSPEDIFGAGLKLSLTGQAEAPSIPPSEYVEALFDSYSGRFDTALVTDLGYRVPQRLSALIDDVAGGEAQFAKVVDLGCGTGLFGEQVRRRSSWLEGYDLSQGMLAKAGEKGIYDHLDQANIGFGLGSGSSSHGIKADLVAAADVLLYFGDLDGVIAVATELMQPGALLAFSCEAGPDEADWLLQSSLRYCHSAAYLRRLADQHGLSIERLEREQIRSDGGKPIEGYLVIARKQADAGLSLAALIPSLADKDAVQEMAEEIADSVSPVLM